MAVYFEGNAFIDECLIQNTDIKDSNITTSTIDMNLQNITNVKDPILDQDAATKKYVDDRVIFTTTDVNLTGTTGSLVFQLTSGSYLVKVDNIVTGGPNGLFNITKNEAANCGQTNRMAAATGTSTGTTVLMEWGINSDLYLRKTDDSYDGTYRVVII